MGSLIKPDQMTQRPCGKTPSSCPTSLGTHGATGQFLNRAKYFHYQDNGCCGTGGGRCGRDEHRKKGKSPLSDYLQHFNPHSWALVDHHDAIGIAQVHDLLGIGVVAGAERVRPQPAQQVEVLHDQGPVEAFATDLGGERHHTLSQCWARASPHALAGHHASLLAPWASFLTAPSLCAVFAFQRGTATHTLRPWLFEQSTRMAVAGKLLALLLPTVSGSCPLPPFHRHYPRGRLGGDRVKKHPGLAGLCAPSEESPPRHTKERPPPLR